MWDEDEDEDEMECVFGGTFIELFIAFNSCFRF